MNTRVSIEDLILALKLLMPTSQAGWITLNQLSNKIYGTTSPQHTDILLATIQLPQNASYFAITQNNKKVKLSQLGLEHLGKIVTKELTLTQKIANSIRSYASKLRPLTLNVEKVTSINKVDNKYIHALFVQIEDNSIAPETPVTFISQNFGQKYGFIVGQEPDGGVIYAAFEHKIYDNDLPGKLTVNSNYLLSRLAEKVEELEGFPSRMQSILKQQASSNNIIIANNNSLEVAESLATYKSPWSKLLWGPPGAGKTYSLGYFVTRLCEIDPDPNFLIVAPSNLAVDNALEKIIYHLERHPKLSRLISERKVLRFGYPRKSSILENQNLLGPHELDELSLSVSELAKKIKKFERENKSETEIASLRTQLMSKQEEIRKCVDFHIRNARIVATSTTLAYLDSSPIKEQEWDTVIVDEVTMVNPALCTFLASLAKKRFLLAGDPQQLGPVYQSQDDSSEEFDWLGKDIFEKCAVSFVENQSRNVKIDDPRLCRITAQRRCADEIWNLVSHLYPQVEKDLNNERIEKLRQLPPFPGKSVVLLDTSIITTPDNQTRKRQKHGSWSNSFTAELCMEVATITAAEAISQDLGMTSIGIISPYRMQVKQLRQRIQKEYQATSTPYEDVIFEAGTVHSFQGSDADIIIFDLVDTFPRRKLGALLSGETGIRLLNVALTRAKGKVIIIVNKKWLREIDCSYNSLLEKIVRSENISEIKVSPPIDNDNRLTESPIEQYLLQAISRNPAFKDIQLQYIIKDNTGNIISRADFAFPKLKYAIYCDGKEWHLRENRWHYDIRQRNKLTELGWIFSVFTGNAVMEDPEKCSAQIYKTFLTRSEALQG